MTASLSQWAAWYLQRGFRALPIRIEGVDGSTKTTKLPLTVPGLFEHGHQDATDDACVLAQVFAAHPDAQLGVVPPAGTFGWDLDGDAHDLIAKLAQELGPLPSTFAHRTPNGEHRIYRWPEEVPHPSTVLGVVTRWGGLNGDASGWLVGAGSRTPDGRQWKVITDQDDNAPPIADFPEAWVAAATTQASTAAGGSGSYLIPNRIAAGHRYPEIARYVASRYKRGLSKAEVWAGLRDVLVPRFVDPLPIEGQDSVRSRFERGWHRTAERLGAPIGERSVRSDGLRFYTPFELTSLVSPQIEWVIRPFVARGAITEIDGKIKAAGKTTLALHMTRAVLDGKIFLGTPTTLSRAVYVTEQSRHTFADALRLTGLADRGDDMRVLFREDFGRASWAEVVTACGELDGFELVVIDTISKLAGVREENSAGDWAQAMSPLQDLAATGRGVVICRHDRKGGGEVGDSGRGSSQASGDVDVILQLRRPEGNQPSTRRVIEALSRFRETPDKLVIDLGGEGYVALGDTEAVAQADALRIVSALLPPSLGGNDTGMTVAEIVDTSKLPRTNVQRALQELEGAGKVTASGEGKKNDPRRYAIGPRNDKSVSALTPMLGGGNE